MDTAELCRQAEMGGGSFMDIEKRLAYIAIKDTNGFNELRPVRCPAKPSSVIAYERLGDMDKQRFLQANPSFFRDGEGGLFYNGRIFAELTTKRNREWLLIMKDIFEKDGNTVFAMKIQERIYEFDDAPETAFQPSMVGNTTWEE